MSHTYTAAELRRAFLDYFAERGHRIVPSSPVVPMDDPTLYFANAGMNQFKPIFLGTAPVPDPPRATSAQKCIRASGKHNDLEDVGFDGRHHTFFEMLGNWSFGDYYKREAITWAWDFLTRVLKLDPARLWATVYEDDEEARLLWLEISGLPPKRVVRFGKKDNFWEMGEVGPCGPCSEIHYDRGPQYGSGDAARDAVNGGSDRIMEVWNLVFIQYNRLVDGSLVELPAKHVDTGAGLERLLTITSGTPGNYETDSFAPLIEWLSARSGIRYESTLEPAPFRVIADHIRALTFAIADGALPSNEGRGYVLRRILRRAARFGRKLGLVDPFLGALSGVVVEHFGAAYPELLAARDHVQRVLHSEEVRFNETLDAGLAMFERETAGLREGLVVPGEAAFKLYDTFGFPLDLTQLLARERGLLVDEEGFHAAMARQQQQSRASSRFAGLAREAGADFEVLHVGATQRFVGYAQLASEAHVIAIKITGDDSAELILDETPFYAEGGGQVGDVGELIAADGFARATVIACHPTPMGSAVVCTLLDGTWEAFTASTVTARVNAAARSATARHHTATHLMHAALRHTLGEHVHQAGSLVEPARLRFDFSHFAALSTDELARIESLVNAAILADHEITSIEQPIAVARERGAMALFGEKYGDVVRTIGIGPEAAVSLELCGGTHVARTGEIGAFRIESEAGIAAGVRRIEAVCGTALLEHMNRDRHLIHALADRLKASPDELPERIARLQEELRASERALEEAKTQAAGGALTSLIAGGEQRGASVWIRAQIDGRTKDELVALADQFRAQVKSGAAVLVSPAEEGKGVIVAVVTDDLVATGVRAPDLLKVITAKLGGAGGGRAYLAQGRLDTLDGLADALQSI